MADKTNGTIGILTAGGDCPGLNAVIRGVSKAAMHYGIKVIGIRDGFRGLVENSTMPLDNALVSGVLTQGGTFLGSSRDKPHKMEVGSKTVDRTDDAVRTYRKLKLDCLVCLGGNGTQKAAYRLHNRGGINVLTLPKTIDNDLPLPPHVPTFGFQTARHVAVETSGKLTRGMTVIDRRTVRDRPAPNCDVLADVDALWADRLVPFEANVRLRKPRPPMSTTWMVQPVSASPACSTAVWTCAPYMPTPPNFGSNAGWTLRIRRWKTFSVSGPSFRM